MGPSGDERKENDRLVVATYHHLLSTISSRQRDDFLDKSYYTGLQTIYSDAARIQVLKSGPEPMWAFPHRFEQRT